MSSLQTEARKLAQQWRYYGPQDARWHRENRARLKFVVGTRRTNRIEVEFGGEIGPDRLIAPPFHTEDDLRTAIGEGSFVSY